MDTKQTSKTNEGHFSIYVRDFMSLDMIREGAKRIYRELCNDEELSPYERFNLTSNLYQIAEHIYLLASEDQESALEKEIEKRGFVQHFDPS